MAKKGRKMTAHESFIWPKRVVRGRWDKVRTIGADFDSSGEEAEDDEFRLSGGMSTAIKNSSEADPFGHNQLDEMVLTEEAEEAGLFGPEVDEFIAQRKSP